MFFLLRNWRRKRVLVKKHIPDGVWQAVLRDVPVLRRLPTADLQRLRDLALLFMHEKSIEPAQGLTLTDAMRTRIAALACLLVLHLDEGLDLYEGFHAVIVYPAEFMVRNRRHMDEAGVMHSSDDLLAGEAWDQGPVVLSWADVEQSGHGAGFNVVAHEFAHKLDLLDGVANGIPPLHRGMDRALWTQTFQHAFDDLCRRVDAGEDTWLDPYATEDPAEFFAVIAEMYFEVPEQLRLHYPTLHAQLDAYFRPRRLD
jgi:Mlc titration factor MtfA (ptsG expression regulator)